MRIKFQKNKRDKMIICVENQKAPQPRTWKRGFGSLATKHGIQFGSS